MGWFFRKTKPAKDLAREGIRCRATVEHAEMVGGSFEASVSEGHLEDLLSGEQTPLRQKLQLRVEPLVGEPYTVKTKVPVPLMKAGWVRAGGTIEVLVDPDDRERLAIDWDGAHEEGSTSAMLADNPLARAALEGAGLDPDRVGREADEARRRMYEPPQGD